MNKHTSGSTRLRSRMILGACLCIWLIAVLLVQIVIVSVHAQGQQADVLVHAMQADPGATVRPIPGNDVDVPARANIAVTVGDSARAGTARVDAAAALRSLVAHVAATGPGVTAIVTMSHAPMSQARMELMRIDHEHARAVGEPMPARRGNRGACSGGVG